MTEAQLTKKLIDYVRKELPQAVVFKHNDRVTTGIPDLSITCGGRTLWVEVKREGNWPPSALQQEIVKRLQKAGTAVYAYFYRVGAKWRMQITWTILAEHPILSGELQDDFKRFVTIVVPKET